MKNGKLAFNPQKNMEKRAVIVICMIIVSILLQNALLYLFPHTGLERILMVPFCIFISFVIAFTYYFVVNKFLHFRKNENIYGIISLILIAFLNIHLFAQDSQKSVWQHLSCYTQVFIKYSDIEYNDIFIPRENPYFTHDNCEYQKYTAALHKFQDQIPYDGSYSIYNKQRNYYNSYGEIDPVLESQEEIYTKLRIGADQVFFKLLTSRYK